jgi:hypothetical protein
MIERLVSRKVIAGERLVLTIGSAKMRKDFFSVCKEQTEILSLRT